MTEDKRNIEKLLQENLKGRKVAVPDFVWGEVEKKIKPKKKRHALFWLWGAGFGILFLGGGYFLWSSPMFKSNEVPCYYADLDRSNGNYLFEKYGQETESYYTVNDEPNGVSTKEALEDLEPSMEDAQPSNFLAGVATDKEPEETLQDLLSTDQNNSSQPEQIITENSEVETETIENPNQDNVERIADNSAEETEENSEDKTIDESDEDNVQSVTDNSTEEGNDITQDETTNGEVEDEPNLSDENLTVENSNEEVVEVVDTVRESTHTENEEELVETDEPSEDSTLIETNTPDDSVPDEPDETPLSNWTLGLHGGYSSFDMAVFKEMFTSGVLSNRTFPSSGMDFNIDLNYHIGDKFSIFTAVHYNRKSTEFNYAVLTDDQGYFQHVIQGNALPVDEINDVDESCNCYLIEDVSANYLITSFFIDLGLRYDFTLTEKLRLGAKLFAGTDLSTSFLLKAPTILDVEDQTRRFSLFKTALGADLGYSLTDHWELAFSSSYHVGFPAVAHEIYARRFSELITGFGINYRF